jgi:hypothetical protein
MEKEEQILEEIKRLNARLDHMHRRNMRHGWLRHILHDLEYNPETQYKVHIRASYFWAVNLVVALILQIFFNDLWDNIAIFYVAVVSLYANFATDYGAASAALAAMHETPLPEIPGPTGAKIGVE